MTTRTHSTAGVHLTPSLHEDAAERAVTVLRAYFAPLSEPGEPRVGYTGGRFDTFDPAGTHSVDFGVFTADDVVSVTLLSVEISGWAATELLQRRREEFRELLEAVGPDQDLVDIESPIESTWPAARLELRLRTLHKVGATKASKLIARKRPRLIPVYDTVINRHLLHGSGRLWEPLRLQLRADNRRLHRHLLALRAAAGLSEQVSPLRVLDVLAWMDGTGNAERELAQVAP